MKSKHTAVTGIILETRKSNTEGLHPVKLRVTINKERKYYTLKGLNKKSLYMNQDSFDAIKSDKQHKALLIHLTAIEKRAMDIIEKMDMFSFELFEERLFSKPHDKGDIFAAIGKKAENLRKEGKINTATAYESTLSSWKAFTGKEKFPFANITIKILNDYEAWMKERKIGKKNPKTPSKTTISIYLKCLKAIFNDSPPPGIAYPFGKGKYIIPRWNNNKRALTQEEVGKIAKFSVADGTMEHRSRDLWLFSYLCNGINFKDLANLKHSNFKEQTIVFERAKTSEASNESSEITVPITRQLRVIIDRWGTNTDYVFDILKQGMTIEEQHRAIKQAIKNTNKYIKRICLDLKIPLATTYTARHSFATVLKRSGASVEYISESLGHKNIKTTQNYLANFEIDEKKKWANMLLPETND